MSTKVTKIDRPTLRLLAEEIAAAAQSVAQKHGLNIRYDGGQYAGLFGTVRLKVSTISDNGVVESEERREWGLYCTSFGFKPEHLDKPFTVRGYDYKISGLKAASGKYPILGLRSDGKTFKFPAEVVKRALGLVEPEPFVVQQRLPMSTMTAEQVSQMADRP